MAVIFLKIKAKNADVAVATASIFNADIRKKNRILLSSLSSQSTKCINIWKLDSVNNIQSHEIIHVEIVLQDALHEK
jgi:hypothetical protein